MEVPNEFIADRMLEEEIAEGARAAQLLAEHLARMGAELTQKNVEVGGREYVVTAVVADLE